MQNKLLRGLIQRIIFNDVLVVDLDLDASQIKNGAGAGRGNGRGGVRGGRGGRGGAGGGGGRRNYEIFAPSHPQAVNQYVKEYNYNKDTGARKFCIKSHISMLTRRVAIANGTCVSFCN